jgi:hypothetical protein
MAFVLYGTWPQSENIAQKITNGCMSVLVRIQLMGGPSAMLDNH